ncbi:hypothetical protein HPP92_004355 [Vanilla planifolia]|uniref:Stress enhanced protein 1, chloroplastic n=1 Tax=Vanilla planifolia TaxID=51239 RepID=A0A835VEE4_VANPL|nr:hypothetical protein HPP92_004768 [Vanilla planifolia]KAG0493361.1 hypothetical protein HPP92_004355 [Vanilla planifolia]
MALTLVAFSMPSVVSKFAVDSAAKSFSRRISSFIISRSGAPLIASSFKSGSPLVVGLAPRRSSKCQAGQVSIRCEQGTKANGGLDVWLGRLAMVGFVTAITVEVVTGKGLLENFGFVTPLPTLALFLTALVGILAAIFIFQSAARD